MARHLLVLLAIVAAAGLTGCKKSAPPAGPSAPAPAPRTWTPEEIAGDPEGYLMDQDRSIVRQIDERNVRLGKLAQRRDEIAARRKALVDNMRDIENVRKRMERALEVAQDEDRWPVQMGGRTFTREKAQAIIKSCQAYVEDRGPLAREYDSALDRLSQMEALMRQELGSLDRLRQRLALDIERVRLNRGMAELGEIRKTETELASFSRQLGQMDEDVLKAAAAADKPPPQMDVENLLK